jgi:membrane associated rhomboid family serine protease
MKWNWNAPVSLAFAGLCLLTFALMHILPDGFWILWTAPPQGEFRWDSPLAWWRCFSHVFGHGDAGHLVGNLSMWLLLAPIVEERLGPKKLIGLMIACAWITGFGNSIWSDSPLLGASGLVFMVLILAAVPRIKGQGVPVSFVLVLVLYLGNEVMKLAEKNQISETTHLLGGIIGAGAGWFWGLRKK